MELTFNSSWDYVSAILNPNDLHFFYYDIGLDHLNGTPIIYEWDNHIQSFLNSKNITIDKFEDNGTAILPNTIEEDKLSFLYIQGQETIAEAFFRHLRNAFAHYRIKRNGEYLFIMDLIPGRQNSITMIGHVKYEDLKQLCFLFFDQRTKLGNILHTN